MIPLVMSNLQAGFLFSAVLARFPNEIPSVSSLHIKSRSAVRERLVFGSLSRHLYFIETALLEALASRSTTCDGLVISLTIRNLREVPVAVPERVFKGPIACTMPAPSGFVLNNARDSSRPNGA